MLFGEEQQKELLYQSKELHKNGTLQNIEETCRAKNGTMIPVLCSWSVMHDKEGRIEGILFVAQDITLRKKTERQLKLRNEELQTFMYKTSHDLQSPITSSLGLINLMKDEITDTRALNYAGLIEESLQRLQRITSQLIEVTRIKQAILNIVSIDFDRFIHGVQNGLSGLNGFEEIEFQYAINNKHQFFL